MQSGTTSAATEERAELGRLWAYLWAEMRLKKTGSTVACGSRKAWCWNHHCIALRLLLWGVHSIMPIAVRQALFVVSVCNSADEHRSMNGSANPEYPSMLTPSADFYLSAEQFAAERTSVFGRAWQLVGPA